MDTLINQSYDQEPSQSISTETPNLFDRAALDELIEHFKADYQDFNSPRYLSEERDFKLRGMQKFQNLLNPDALADLLNRGEFEEVKTRIKQVANATILMNRFDKLPLLNAEAEKMSRSFQDYLYGRDTLEARFGRWVAFLASVPNSKIKPGLWPASTYFLMLARPDKYIFVKPTAFGEFMQAVNSPLRTQYTAKPRAVYYNQLVEMAGHLQTALAPLGAHDIIDVQSFIWIMAKDNSVTLPVVNPSPSTPNPVVASVDPDVIVDPNTNLVRVHFPRNLWDTAWKNNLIAIGFADKPTNISVQRLRKLKVGDRVVGYVQNGTIGGVGIVTRPYYQAEGEGARLFNGDYLQRVGVSWSDELAQPTVLLTTLQQPQYKELYNKLKNPHTIVPLQREDYSTILNLLGIQDVGLPDTETRLPVAWSKLTDYADFVFNKLEPAWQYEAEALYQLAKDFGHDLSSEAEPLTLADELRQFRLVTAGGDGKFSLQPYVAGDRDNLLKLMALALLIPVEGTSDTYELPALKIMKGLPVKEEPVEDFAPDLKQDSHRLLGWYAEAGLTTIQLTPDGVTIESWTAELDSFNPAPGSDPASDMYARFFQVVKEQLSGVPPSALAPVKGGPLPMTADLEERIKQLGKHLLIDSQVIRRIYASLVSGRHVVLSGPPGTGKTELAKLLPSLLWSEPGSDLNELPLDLDQVPVVTTHQERHGYAVNLVTATEDWSVRDVVGGIGPRLASEGGLQYVMQFGHLTRTVLQNYAGTGNGQTLPRQPQRAEYRGEQDRRYRGVWLVIDEFTRAPVDAAFGSLLITLGGGKEAFLAVPTGDGESGLRVPDDFRIIGTLNSFDRHFYSVALRLEWE